MYYKKKVVLIYSLVFSLFLLVALITLYFVPKYKTETVNSFRSINELKSILDDFPSIGSITYIRREQAGTVGILFTGKASLDNIEKFCSQQDCIIYPAEEKKQIWQDRLLLYRLPENFSATYTGSDFCFDGPESLRDNKYRILFLYMPNEQRFIGEIFFFR